MSPKIRVDTNTVSRDLARLLVGIGSIDPSSPGTVVPGLGDYWDRNSAIWLALRWASLLGYPHGVKRNDEDPDWPVAFIELPNGQISWHIPSYPGSWNGHTTEEKYELIADYYTQLFSQVPPAPPRGRLRTIWHRLRRRGSPLL